MINPNVAIGLSNLFKRRSEFVVIGLTGRTGSGCSTAATLLMGTFQNLKAPPANTNKPTPEDRKYRIARDYAEKHWKPFIGISVSNVILTFSLDENQNELEDFLRLPSNALNSDHINIFMDQWRTHAKLWKDNCYLLQNSRGSIDEKRKFLKYWQENFSKFFIHVRGALGADANKLLQLIGDNIRKSGNSISNEPDPENFFKLPARVSSIIELIHDVQNAEGKPTYIVIDALRNPFELLYFRERFASFYVLAINTDNSDRVNRLGGLNFSPQQILDLDQKEYPKKGKPFSGYDAFTSQNIQSCFEKADIYIRNNGYVDSTQQPNISELTVQLTRYFSLLLHPGLITPTQSERCMQIAFAARANSGCISRQVGAAITDKHGSIKAVGWNDVPSGQVPCILRRATDLLSNSDDEAFSSFEFSNKKFRTQVEKSYKRYALVNMDGRSSPYCFKSEYNASENTDNQVHTRSLHAEENAFLQISKYGGEGIYGGNLYTTASPCELCAKKAFQLGIRKIFYVDPYPGISLSHILQSGPEEARPIVELYQGAVGQAYHRLYDPVLPFKDELRAMMDGGEETPIHGPDFPASITRQMF